MANPVKIAYLAFKQALKDNQLERAKELLKDNNYSVTKNPKEKKNNK